MRENKFEKSHIHILQSETLSRESRITESAQEVVDSIVSIVDLFRHMSTLIYFWCRGKIYKNRGFYLEGVWLWRISGSYSQEIIFHLKKFHASWLHLLRLSQFLNSLIYWRITAKIIP